MLERNESLGCLILQVTAQAGQPVIGISVYNLTAADVRIVLTKALESLESPLLLPPEPPKLRVN